MPALLNCLADNQLNFEVVLRPNLIRDPGFESFFRIWDWFESFFQDSNLGFANDSQDFVKILRGFVEKWKKILTFGNLKCKVLLKNARFLLEDSQKSQNWKIDSDLPLIRISKLKIRWRLESLKLGSGLNTRAQYNHFEMWEQVPSNSVNLSALEQMKSVARST